MGETLLETPLIISVAFENSRGERAEYGDKNDANQAQDQLNILTPPENPVLAWLIPLVLLNAAMLQYVPSLSSTTLLIRHTFYNTLHSHHDCLPKPQR